MPRRTIAFFALGALAMVAIVVGGSRPVLDAAGAATGLLGLVAILIGLRSYNCSRPSIWWLLALAEVSTSMPKSFASAPGSVGLTQLLLAVGNVCAIAAPLLMVRARGGRDRDEALDGWILTLAMAVGLHQFLLAGQSEGALVPQPVVLGLTVVAGISVAAGIRLVFLATRVPSAWFLLVSTVGGQLIGVWLALANSGVTPIGIGTDVLGGISRLAIGAAAILPGMTQLTTPVERRGGLPYARLILLGIALPATVVAVFVDTAGRIVLSLAGVGVVSIIVLILVRMWRLLNEQERARRRQTLLAELGTQALAEDDEGAFVSRIVAVASQALRADAAGVVLPGDADDGPGTCLRIPLETDDGAVLQLRRDRNVPFSADEHIWALAVGATLSSAVRRYRTQAQVHHASLHDSLTGLPNRASLVSALQQAVCEDVAGGVALLFVDLDRFKSVNDTLGHRAGDQLLVAAAERVRAVLRDDDVLSRLAGDEFVVLCRHLPDSTVADRVAARIVAELARPFMLDEGVASIGASVGVAVYDGQETPEQLLHRADTSMYRAKQQTQRQDDRTTAPGRP